MGISTGKWLDLPVSNDPFPFFCSGNEGSNFALLGKMSCWRIGHQHTL